MVGHESGIIFSSTLAILAVIGCIVLFATRPPRSTVANIMNVSTTTYNWTLSGYCENFTILAYATKVGRVVTLEIPSFQCDGSVNPGDTFGGCYTALPPSLHSVNAPSVEAPWFSSPTGIFEGTNDTANSIINGYVWMGFLVTTQDPVPSNAYYGPPLGMTFQYTATTAEPVVITSSSRTTDRMAMTYLMALGGAAAVIGTNGGPLF